MWAGITHIELNELETKLFRLASCNVRHLIACIFWKVVYNVR